MRPNKFLSLILISFVIAMVGGCAKTEGEGGAATISGKVMVQDYTSSEVKNGAPYPAANFKVYIIYGNGTTYNDDFDCSYDGSYQFKNLRKGNYKIFVYSEIVPTPADPPTKEAIFQAVTITDKKGNYTVPDITINKH